MRVISIIVLVVLVVPGVLTQGGCSVAMALNGQADPDLLMMTPGTSRADVETQLGLPAEESALDGGLVQCTYEYTTGNEPNLGRALIHGAFDALSFGIWEVAGIGIESAVEENDRALVVVYDESDHIASVEHRELARRTEDAVAVVEDGGFE